ncbi:MAG: cold shock domain-containing protein [Lentimicrobiaceae bacterium]|jgi:cold shock CspA family protein|nr:cold shock domain-containing protein [Lentimicrobiaceae bacterium]
MARSTSSNKRDNEKKKIAKRKEKEKRKEDKKNSNQEKTFEDMIAYVDENGQIVSERPEITKNNSPKVESILISTPKKIEEDSDAIKGKVEYFNAPKGYGFIKSSANDEKYFFHISNSPENIAEGNVVSFEIRRGLRGAEVFNIKIES